MIAEQFDQNQQIMPKQGKKNTQMHISSSSLFPNVLQKKKNPFIVEKKKKKNEVNKLSLSMSKSLLLQPKFGLFIWSEQVDVKDKTK